MIKLDLMTTGTRRGPIPPGLIAGLAALALWASAIAPAGAQYVPIPNYIGIGAGAKFRGDLNNHLSGASAIAPRLVPLFFAQLPAEVDGQLYWLRDGSSSNPCTGGGTGAVAIGMQGQWNCEAGASGAAVGGFPLTSNVTAAAHRIQNLAPNNTSGDALSQGQSHLNDLGAATASYSMGANRLQNLGAATAAGDAIGYGQSGASLNGLSLNGNALMGLGAGTANGQAITYGQKNAQLTANKAAIAEVSSNVGGASTSPVVVNAPATITSGNALVLVVGAGSLPTFTLPSGFTAIRSDTGNSSWTQQIACKTATGAEPGSYSISFTGGSNQGIAGIIQLSGTDCAHLDANAGGGTNNVINFTLPTLTTTQNSEFIVDAGSWGCSDVPRLSVGQVFVANSGNGFLTIAGYGNSIAGTSLTPVMGPLNTNNCSQFGTNWAGQQVSFIPNATTTAVPLVSNQVGAQVQTLNASVNNIIDVMAPPYAALGDGNTDDTNAIQQAIYDACGATPPAAFPTATRKTVYLPRSPVCYLHSAPLRLPCTHLEVKGDAGTALCQNYIGDAIIENGWGTGVLPYSTALVGTGNSLVSAAGQLKETIDLARVLNGTSNLNSLLASGFNISFYMKATASGGEILDSTPAYPGTGNGAFNFSYSGANQVVGMVNTVTGGLVTVGTCSAQTLGNVYEIELDWDGTTYRLWQGTPGGTAVLCGSVASSNRVTQGMFEEMLLPAGGPHQFWPDGSSTTQNAFVGFLDSLRFEHGTVHAAPYTVPNAKSTADGGTILLENFPTSLDGTQTAQVGNISGVAQGSTSYLTVLDLNAAIGATAYDYIHDMELCALAAAPGLSGKPDGLFANVANNAKWANLSCSNAYYVQGDFFGNDYLARLDNWNGFGGHVGLNFNSAWNDSVNSDAQIDGTDGACEVYHGGGGGDHEDYHSRCVDRGNLRYGWIENQSQGNYYYPFVDQEAGNTSFVTTFLLNAPAQPYNFISGNIDTRNSAPYVQQDNGGVGSTFIGTIFNNFGQLTAAPEIIDYTNGSPTTPTLLLNVFNPSNVALSNQAGNPYILELGVGAGQNSLMQNLELQQVPKFDVGLNHLTVSAIADPAAATIAVVGATGTTSYGPYFVVCHDVNGGVTLVSPSSNTVANGPATLSAGNYINVAWSAVSGCTSWDVLKGSTATSLALGVSGTSYHDIGGATSAYTAPGRNTTGDVSGLAQISTGTTFAKLPGTVLNGARMYCSNCDPPTNPPGACTSSGARSGAFADGVNGQWLCVP